MSNTKTQLVAFAYFADNKFIGWYADSFGSVRDTPKIYGNTPHQIEVISKNFKNKISKIQKTSFEVEKEKVYGIASIGLAIFDSEKLLRGKSVELRVVNVPYIHDETNRWQWMSDNYEKLKEWSQHEPTEFIKIITDKI